MYKNGTRRDPANYKPINHTPAVYRIKKHSIKKQLTLYFVDYELLNTSHHSVPQRKPCTTCMTDGLDMITTAANAGNSVILIYLCTTKAFDRASQRRLINTIKCYWITWPMRLWFTLWLSSGNQTVGANCSTPAPNQWMGAQSKAVYKSPWCYFSTQTTSPKLSETAFLSYSPKTSKSFTASSLGV